MTITVPSNARLSARCFAAPSSIVVWPSWPQACILPGTVEAQGAPVASLMGKRVHVGAQADASRPEPLL